MVKLVQVFASFGGILAVSEKIQYHFFAIKSSLQLNFTSAFKLELLTGLAFVDYAKMLGLK